MGFMVKFVDIKTTNVVCQYFLPEEPEHEIGEMVMLTGGDSFKIHTVVSTVMYPASMDSDLLIMVGGAFLPAPPPSSTYAWEFVE